MRILPSPSSNSEPLSCSSSPVGKSYAEAPGEERDRVAGEKTYI